MLRDRITLFANQISEILHGIVYKYSGSANKNIGGSYLLIWKFETEDTRVNYLTGELELLPSYQVTQLCEMSMISFLKVIAGLQRSHRLTEYRSHRGLISAC